MPLERVVWREFGEESWMNKESWTKRVGSGELGLELGVGS